MSNEQPTIGKIEQLTTTTEQERIERIKALRGKYANQFPPSDQRDKGELDRLRAENARLQTELDEHRSALILIRDMGALLSNMAYNLAQDERVNEITRNDLNRLRVAWDEANRQLAEPIHR